MSIYNSFKTNEKAELEGLDLVYNFKPEYKNSDGTWPTFKVRRAGGANSKDYDLARERARRPYKDKDVLDDLEARAILLDAFLDAILISWENIPGADGVYIPYSYQAAKAFFKEVPELFLELNSKLYQRDLFQDKILKVEAKNL